MTLGFRKFSALALSALFFLASNFFNSAFGVDSQKLPQAGYPCKASSVSVSTKFNKYLCVKAKGAYSWQIQKNSYKSPVEYAKGFAIGQQLSFSNPRTSGDLRCMDAYYGRVVKNDLIQEGKVSSETSKILSSYYGYLGCMDGADSRGKKPSASLDFPEPLNAPGLFIQSASKQKPWSITLRNGNHLNETDFENLRANIEIGCSNEDEPGRARNCSEVLIQQQFPGAFNEEKTNSCTQERVNSNWSITGLNFILPTLSFDPTWNPNEFENVEDGLFADREEIQIFDQVPLRVLSLIRYQDDLNQSFQFYGWLHLLTWDDHTLVHFLSPCATFIESQSSFFVDLPRAPSGFKVPLGKVDKLSNTYKLMFNVGSNFAKVSMSSDTALKQCASAAKDGLISNRGIPQYLGVQARQIQSNLKTASGFQGCLDGFSSWVNGDLD